MFGAFLEKYFKLNLTFTENKHSRRKVFSALITSHQVKHWLKKINLALHKNFCIRKLTDE